MEDQAVKIENLSSQIAQNTIISNQVDDPNKKILRELTTSQIPVKKQVRYHVNTQTLAHTT